MLTLLGDEKDGFPNVEAASSDPDGLLAFGGDLSPTRLLDAYKNGIFPWFSEGDPIMWWSPSERCVVYPEHYTPGKSLKKLYKKHSFKLSINQAFEQVITACAQKTPERPDTWISEAIITAYCQLFRLGYAHSIEVWQNNQLVGGLYGVQINSIFCGESMFSRVSDASKVAFLHLIEQAKQKNIALIDCQLENSHLNRLGATLISRTHFISQLRQATLRPTATLGEPATDNEYR